MRLILLGPPGAGKGTQAAGLADRYGVPHVATGDLLRGEVAAGTDLGNRAKSYMAAGELVPDGLVLELLRRRLEQADAEKGFLLDGFPRNPKQAEDLGKILHEIGQPIDAVISFEVPDEVIVRRLSSRASCPQCGRPYTAPHGRPATCPVDGTGLLHRSDDTPEVIRRRLQVFREQTAPLIAYYEEQGCLVHVNGVGDVFEVQERIAQELDGRS